MTIPQERFNSIRNCKSYLESILNQERKFPTSVKESVEVSYRLLKHFPENNWIDKLEELYNDVLNKKGKG